MNGDGRSSKTGSVSPDYGDGGIDGHGPVCGSVVSAPHDVLGNIDLSSGHVCEIGSDCRGGGTVYHDRGRCYSDRHGPLTDFSGTRSAQSHHVAKRAPLDHNVVIGCPAMTQHDGVGFPRVMVCIRRPVT